MHMRKKTTINTGTMNKNRENNDIDIKHIAQYTGVLKSGGIEKFVLNIFDNIDKSLVTFDFIIDEYSDADPSLVEYVVSNGGLVIPTFPVGYKGNAIIRKIRKLYNFMRIIRRNKYDVVHVHMSYSSTMLYCALAKMAHVKKVIAHAHASGDGNIGKAQKIITRISKKTLTGFCDLLFATSKQAGDYMFGTNSCVRIVKNGIDINKFQFDSKNRNIERKRLGVSNDEILLGHVGRFADVKNHVFLIQIMSCLKSTEKSYKLVLVGEGPLKENIQSMVEENKLNDRVIFYGISDHVERLFSAMDLFLLPSKYEGLGIVAIEAQANGLHSLVSEGVPNEAMVSDIIEKIPIDNLEKWVERILSANTERKDVRKEIYNSGFDSYCVASNLMDIYFERRS